MSGRNSCVWMAALLALSAPACDSNDPSSCEEGAVQCRPEGSDTDALEVDSGSDEDGGDGTALVTLDVRGPGVVSYQVQRGGVKSCLDTCPIEVQVGDAIDFQAAPGDAFTVWDGTDCVGPFCHIQVTEPITLVATFEQPSGWGDRVLLQGLSADFDAAGALNVAGRRSGAAALLHYGADGQLLWQVDLPGTQATRILGVDADSEASVYVLVERGMLDSLHKVTVDGTLAWTKPISGWSGADGGFGDLIAVTPADQVAVAVGVTFGNSSLLVFDKDGAPIGSANDLSWPRALAAHPGGDLIVAVEGFDPDNTDALQFAVDGTPIGNHDDPIRVPGYYQVHMTVDATGSTVASTSGHGNVWVSRLAADGFTLVSDEIGSAWIDSGVAVAASGDVISAHALNGDDYFSGAEIQILDPSGAVLDTITRAPVLEGGSVVVGLAPQGIAADGTGRFALVSDELNELGVFGAIEVFAP